METKELICIGCPMGCYLTVKIHDGEMNVSGNTCPRGADYAKKELTDPRRILTTTVKVDGGTHAVIPVKSQSDLPKGKLFSCLWILKETQVKAPVQIGQIIVENIAGTGVDIVAAKGMEATQ